MLLTAECCSVLTADQLTADCCRYLHGRYEGEKKRNPSQEPTFPPPDLVTALAVCGYWPDKNHPSRAEPRDTLIPIGALKGKCMARLVLDAAKLSWFGQEADLRELYPLVSPCNCWLPWLMSILQMFEALYELEALPRPAGLAQAPPVDDNDQPNTRSGRMMEFLQKLDEEGGGCLYGKQPPRKRKSPANYGPCNDCKKRFTTKRRWQIHLRDKPCLNKRKAKIDRPVKLLRVC